MDVPMDTSDSVAQAPSSKRLYSDVSQVRTVGYHRRVKSPTGKQPNVEAVVSERVTLVGIEASADAWFAEDDFLVRDVKYHELVRLVNSKQRQCRDNWQPYSHYQNGASDRFFALEAERKVVDLRSQADVEHAVVEQQGIASRAVDISFKMDITSGV